MDIYVEAQFAFQDKETKEEKFSLNASFSINITDYSLLEKNTTNIEVKLSRTFIDDRNQNFII